MDKKDIDELLFKLNEIIHLLEKENFDMIIAINRGGVIPAGIINQKLNLPLNVININYRDEKNLPRYDAPRLMNKLNIDTKNKKILLVDDISRSKKTMAFAKKFLGKNVKTFVINGEADYSLYNCECFIMPWAVKNE